jgi:hypothetical protein
MTSPEPDPLSNLVQRLGMDGLDDFDEIASPLFWPTLSASDAEAEWESLRLWVERFRRRFPHATKIPDCWYKHGDLVEALSALRDHERASYSSTAPPTAALEWHRAFRDIENRYESWIRRFKCQGDPARSHQHSEPDERPPTDWAEFVRRDVAARNELQIHAALGP